MAKSRSLTEADVQAAKNPAPSSTRLRGTLPVASKRLKFGLFGGTGVGKTMAALNMPAPYVFDCEDGTSHYADIVRENNGAVLCTVDTDEVCDELRKLIRYSHPYKTVVIDPLTILWDEALMVGERLVGTSYNKHYGYASNRIKEVMTLLTRVDMNVVVTAHEKDDYADDKKVGVKMDAWKRTPYLFDLIINLSMLGGRRIGRVTKTRLDAFPLNDQFEFSHDEFRKRATPGWDAEATPAELVSHEDAQRLEGLIKTTGVSEKTVEKWLKKAKAANLIDLPADAAAKCIAFLEQDAAKILNNEDKD